MTEQFDSSLARASTASVLLAILIIFLGLAMIALPVIPSIGVVLGIAFLMIFSGIVHFVNSLRSRGTTNLVWNLLVSMCYLVTGIYLFARPILGLAGWTLALAIFFFVKGIVDIFAYLSGRQVGVSSWMLLDGIVTLLLGVMIWRQWPMSSFWAAGTMVGVGVLFSGMSRLMMALARRRLITSHGDSPLRRAA